ncbi:MAG: sulfotransferase [Rubrobacter sp.]|nr:sulfotransferase [Rubrobacter sp.]
MNMDHILERLREYRLQNERFDRLVRGVMSYEPAARAVRAATSAASGLSRRSGAERPGDYDTVFFIAGEMRSGTSWLRRTLSAHPKVACGHEGSFFGRDYDREEIPVYTAPVSSLTRALTASGELETWHGLPWNQWAEDYEEDLNNLARLCVDYFLAKEVARTGKRVVGDKSPQHTANLDEIHTIYPDARVIHVIRDGRDVAVSAMNHWWRLAQDREEAVFELAPEELEIRDAYSQDKDAFRAAGRSIFTGERLEQLARRWDHRVGKARRDGTELYGGQYLEVRYEDLLAETPGHLGKMLRFLGVSAAEEDVERCLRASSFERASSRRQGEEDAGSFFRKGVAGDWKNVFTARDRELYEEIAGPALAQFGYETSGREA